MAKIINGNQEIEIVNITENESLASLVTQYPVESGAPISDHTQISGKTLQVTGFLLGDKAESDYTTLEKWKNEGKLVSFKGRVYLRNLSITDISKGYDRIENGFSINIS